ncbi:MAG: hypothetical protein ACRD6N_11875 [Pyrinomonadaceae bacterium]
MTNKLLPVALIAALIGGSVGAFVMHSSNEPASQASTQKSSLSAADAQAQNLTSDFDTPAEQTAYKTGFADGFRAAQGDAAGYQSSAIVTNPTRRVVYRQAARSYAPQRVYYNYNQPRSRSFWQKHRDKLTVAMGTGGGALIGGLIGGKKGAGIGALAGAGGSALYTYKLRDRSRRY